MKIDLQLCMILCVFFLGCEPEAEKASLNLKVQFIENPVATGSELPDLYNAESGELYLSWVHREKDSLDFLQYSVLEDDQWSPVRTIASGDNWFVNWADFPSLIAYKNDGQSLAAHWLSYRGDGTYEYDVSVSQSNDNGRTWQTPFHPHTDGVAAEHGFVSMLPLSADRILLTWLDGRFTVEKEGNEGVHGAMTLRTASVDIEGQLYAEAELDDRVCDCCQTAAALTDLGPIVAYRDRSVEEIRDISVVRKINGQWSRPQNLHPDNWLINGCPVNGPAMVARGKQVAIAWYTGANEKAEVKLMFSENSGQDFTGPIRIDDGKPLGRVGIQFMEAGKVVISWMEDKGNGKAEIRIAFAGKEGKYGKSQIVAETSSARASGFPALAVNEDKIYMSWTKPDSLNTVKTALLLSE